MVSLFVIGLRCDVLPRHNCDAIHSSDRSLEICIYLFFWHSCIMYPLCYLYFLYSDSDSDSDFSSTHRDKLQPQSRVSLRDLQKSSTNSRPAPNATTSSSNPSPAPAPAPASGLALPTEQPDTLLLSNLSLTTAEKGSLAAAAEPYDSISLADVAVPLESIKPSKQKK